MRHRPRFRPDREKRTEKVYIYGKHALLEALLNCPQVVRKIFLLEDMYEGDLRAAIQKEKVPVSFLRAREASRMVGEDTSHQGVIGVLAPDRLLRDFNEFTRGLSPDAQTMLVLLDELTDPHNVGAIIRSAAAFGASGVLIPSRNQAPITGAVVKSSAGMVFRVPLVSVGNVNYAIDDLREKGFQTYGLEMNGSAAIAEEKFPEPTLFVVGNEGRGIREKTLARCDVTLRIPMDPRCESLNASVSAAIVLYAWSHKHPDLLRHK